jgi:hypothetical protein
MFHVLLDGCTIVLVFKQRFSGLVVWRAFSVRDSETTKGIREWGSNPHGTNFFLFISLTTSDKVLARRGHEWCSGVQRCKVTTQGSKSPHLPQSIRQNHTGQLRKQNHPQHDFKAAKVISIARNCYRKRSTSIRDYRSTER